MTVSMYSTREPASRPWGFSTWRFQNAEREHRPRLPSRPRSVWKKPPTPRRFLGSMSLAAKLSKSRVSRWVQEAKTDSPRLTW